MDKSVKGEHWAASHPPLERQLFVTLINDKAALPCLRIEPGLFILGRAKNQAADERVHVLGEDGAEEDGGIESGPSQRGAQQDARLVGFVDMCLGQ